MNEDTPEVKQYRKRVKGFAKYASYDNGEDEFVEVPEECPVVCCAAGILIETDE